MERLFIEASGFTSRIKNIGSNTLLVEIQDEILREPTKGDVVQEQAEFENFESSTKNVGVGRAVAFGFCIWICQIALVLI